MYLKGNWSVWLMIGSYMCCGGDEYSLGCIRCDHTRDPIFVRKEIRVSRFIYVNLRLGPCPNIKDYEVTGSKNDIGVGKSTDAWKSSVMVSLYNDSTKREKRK